MTRSDTRLTAGWFRSVYREVFMSGRCLVTGGAGFIGSHLVDALRALGRPVRVFDDFSTGQPGNVPGGVEVVRGCVTDAAAVEQATDGCEVVFHLAALASVAKSVEDPPASHAVCATGTLHVLNAARKAGVRRVVYAGSASAYGRGSQGEPAGGSPSQAARGSQGEPAGGSPSQAARGSQGEPARGSHPTEAGGSDPAGQDEDTPLVALSPYAAAKLAGEFYCQAFAHTYGLETVRLRFFNVFGPRQRPDSPYSGVIAIFTAALTSGRTPTVHGDGLQSRDFVYVSDVADALVRAADTPGVSGRVYNVGTGGSVTLLDLVRELNAILGTTVTPTHGPPRAGDIRHSRAKIDRIRADLGYAPRVTFAEGLRRTLEWYRAEASGQ